MNSTNPNRDPRDEHNGRDFADFLAGSGRLDPEATLPLPSDEEQAVAPKVYKEDLTAAGSDAEPTRAQPASSTTVLVGDDTGKAKPVKSSDDAPDSVKKETGEDEHLHGETRDRAEVIGTSMRWFAGWCLRFLIMAIAAYILFNVIGKLWAGILPVLLSLIVCTVLWPIVRTLRKAHVPNALAVLLAMLGFFAVIGGIFAMIAPPAVSQSRELIDKASDGLVTIRDWLAGPPLRLEETQLNDALTQATTWLQDQSGKIASEVAAGASATLSAIATLVVMLVLTFFFLKDGEHFLPLIRRVTGRRVGWHLTEVFTRMWSTLGGFIRAQAIVSFIDAFFIGLGLVILDVPLAGALAVLTFFAGFIPMIGAFTAGALSVLIALVANDFTTALIVLAIIIAVQQLEGNILQPMLQSRAMDVHPVIILLAVTVGSALFQIIGAFLAVPVAAMIVVVFRYMGDLTDLATGEKRSEEIKFATHAGEMSGAHSERAAQRWQELRKQMKQETERLSFGNLLNPLRGNDKNSSSEK